MVAFKNGAGSIRAYPHAENTGLVISDGAKIHTISEISNFFSTFLTKGLNISSTIVDQENRPCDSFPSQMMQRYEIIWEHKQKIREKFQISVKQQ